MGVIWDSLRSIWPRGRLLPDEPLVGGISDAIEDLRVSGRSLLTESWPGTATDTLRQWHDTLGQRYDEGVTVEGQRIRLSAAMTAKGGSTVGLLEAQLQKEFPDVYVTETTFSSEAGEDECGLAECGDSTGVLDPNTYTLTGEIPDDESAARIRSILARYAPAHMDAVSDINVLSTTDSSEAGEDQCGVAVAEGYDGFAPVAPVFTVDASISGSGEPGTVIWAYPGVVTGSPTPSLTYQWKKDTVDIPGATSNWMMITEGGSWTCVVTATNAGGSDTSTSNAIVTPNVLPFLVSGPTITPIGNTITVSASFGGFPTPVVTYQWRKDGVDIAGQVVTTLDLTGRGVGSYDCVITATNAAGAPTWTSDATVVSVPVITWGGDIQFSYFAPLNRITVQLDPLHSPSVTGFPTPVVTYQWYKNGSTWSTNASFTYSSPVIGDEFYCVLTATNDAGSDDQTSDTLINTEYE